MSNPINSRTVLIEENAFRAELLRFESEPWTRFYIAGEVIRELRKATGKQSSYASKGNSEAHVVEEEECKSVGCGPAPVSSSLPTELINGKTSRRHWASRTRISSPSSVFPRALLSDATRYPELDEGSTGQPRFFTGNATVRVIPRPVSAAVAILASTKTMDRPRREPKWQRQSKRGPS